MDTAVLIPKSSSNSTLIYATFLLQDYLEYLWYPEIYQNRVAFYIFPLFFTFD